MVTTFEGVVTTGIYCRAGCSAQPDPGNVVPVSSPVAAEAAGFRACLRCRPDRQPPPQTAVDTPAVVRHAMALISDGFLDRSTEVELGRTVGMSPRQLRRVFVDTIGATPHQVATSRRAHFARRLLDETDLSITDIAFAAGFQSVRQMNRTMRELFRRSPTELRNRRSSRDRLVADGGLRLRLPVAGRYDLATMTEYLAPRAIPGVESVIDGVYRRTIMSCGHPGAIEVLAGDRGHVELVAHLPTFTALIDQVAAVRHLFGLDDDASAALRSLRRDPMLAPSIGRTPGLRMPGAWDRFETAVRVILGQQISVAAATTLAGRLAEAHGIGVPGLEPFELRHVFPSAETLAIVPLDDIGLTRTRAATIRSFARAVVDGRIDLAGPGDRSEAVASLVELPGIGPWTAELIAMRAMRLPDAFPASDLGLRRNAGRVLGRTDDVTTEDLLERAEAWRPHRALAAIHLWASTPT